MMDQSESTAAPVEPLAVVVGELPLEAAAEWELSSSSVALH